MRGALLVIVVAVLSANCGGSGSPPDLAVPADLAPPDLTAPPADLSTPDLAVPADLEPADLATMATPDLATLDLCAAPDLTPPADLAPPDAGACGKRSQPCCHGAAGHAPCDDVQNWSTCVDNVCVACGGAGQPCCDLFYPRACIPSGYACSAGTCVPCGQPTQPCCPPVTAPNACVDTTQQHAFCRDSTCTACGFYQQACCLMNYGTSWIGGCSGVGGRQSCQTIGGVQQCAPCGGAGQPAC